MPEVSINPYASIADIAESIKGGALSPVALTEYMLERIAAFDPSINSYVTVTAEQAIEQAKTAEKQVAAGEYLGPLHGVPIALKDLFDTKGVETEIGSTIYRGRLPEQDAFVVDKLKKSGAILLGKTAMTEFAAAGYHPSKEPPKNPWNVRHGPGVSSGGSGAALAAGLCFGSLGTDTGGSIRMPSAACGTVGLKPTYGLVSRSGVFPLSHTLDHVGPMARTVEDVALILDAIAGYDPADPVSVRCESRSVAESESGSLEGFVIGVDRRYCANDVDQEVAGNVLSSLDVFAEAGAEIREVDVGWLADVGAIWKKVLSTDALIVHESTWPEKASSYGPVFREILHYGETISGVEIAQAFQQRDTLKQRVRALLADIDMLLCPSEPFPAPSWEQFPPQFITPLTALAWVLRFAAPFNFSGHPTLALPCGFTSSGLPTGMQLVGRYFEEPSLFRAGRAYQRKTDWHKRHPELGRSESERKQCG